MKVIEDLLFRWQDGWGSDAIPAHPILLIYLEKTVSGDGGIMFQLI
jgi:hypothetical protein